MCDPQSGRVGVDPVGDHAVENRPAGSNLVTGQQTHNAWVSMVELDQNRTEWIRKRRITETWRRPARTHRLHGVEEVSDAGRAVLNRLLSLRQVSHRVTCSRARTRTHREVRVTA